MFWQLFTILLSLHLFTCQELGFPGATNDDSLEDLNQNICQTLNGQNCVLPFKYENVSYSGCITLNDPDNLPWCSTKVSNRLHFKFFRIS